MKRKKYVDPIGLKDIIRLPLLNELKSKVKNRNKSSVNISKNQLDIPSKLRLPPSLTPYKTSFIKKK